MELENKIKEIIFGLFGSIIASFGVSLGASFLTNNHWTVLLSGLIVGIASSIANSFGPLVAITQSHDRRPYSEQDFEQVIGSSLLTFIIVGLPLVPYVLLSELGISRVISVITGLALLFIFGVHQAELEHKSPLAYGFTMALIGLVCAWIFYLLALFFR
ncbi:MAG TPA: VIT1/CCC1 transporter family protein [Candidatus Bathyarchaeia archaeon]|nr:VIT1/CCC1 transporter family protein [Candidatus Bathyarchaeia archaeon]